jgi:hypothetical protein
VIGFQSNSLIQIPGRRSGDFFSVADDQLPQISIVAEVGSKDVKMAVINDMWQ